MEQWKGFGPKKVSNVLAAIEASKQQPTHVLLAGLAIPAVGQHLAKLLLKHCGGSVLVCRSPPLRSLAPRFCRAAVDMSLPRSRRFLLLARPSDA